MTDETKLASEASAASGVPPATGDARGLDGGRSEAAETKWNLPPVVGAVYDVRHSRKGRFAVRVLDVSGEWLTGEIVEGKADAMCAYNRRERGEEITIRDVHSLLRLVRAPATVQPASEPVNAPIPPGAEASEVRDPRRP